MSIFANIFDFNKKRLIKKRVHTLINNLEDVNRVKDIEEFKNWLIKVRCDWTIDELLDTIYKAPKIHLLEALNKSLKKYEVVMQEELEKLQATMELVMQNKNSLSIETINAITTFVTNRNIYLSNIRDAYKCVVTVLAK